MARFEGAAKGSDDGATVSAAVGADESASGKGFDSAEVVKSAVATVVNAADAGGAGTAATAATAAEAAAAAARRSAASAASRRFWRIAGADPASAPPGVEGSVAGADRALIGGCIRSFASGTNASVVQTLGSVVELLELFSKGAE